MDISSADNACGMQARREKAVPVAAIFDQLFQIIEEDWGYSPQLPAAFVVPDKYRITPWSTTCSRYMQAHTPVMNKNQAKLAISKDKTHNSQLIKKTSVSLRKQ